MRMASGLHHLARFLRASHPIDFMPARCVCPGPVKNDSSGEPMQRMLHSLARGAVGIAIACGATLSNGVLADTVFKDPDAHIDARTELSAAPHPEGKRGLLSSVMS